MVPINKNSPSPFFSPLFLIFLFFPRFSPAEQAINAIFMLSEHPDQICSKFVKGLSSLIFLKQKEEGERAKKDKKGKGKKGGDEEMEDEDKSEEDKDGEDEEEEGEEEDEQKDNEGAYKRKCSTSLLSRFLFVLGHVALKQLVRIPTT